MMTRYRFFLASSGVTANGRVFGIRINFLTAFGVTGLSFQSISLDAVASTRTAASPAYGDVVAAVANSSNGDTVNVPAGSATWNSTLNLGTKAISLIGAGSGSTIITNGVGCLIKSNNTGSNIVRISGFRFNSSDNQTPIVSFAGPSYKVRVDHCYFNKGDCAIGTNDPFGGASGTGPVWGVVDHCQFYNMKRPYFAMDMRLATIRHGGQQAWNDWHANKSIYPGSEKMMYFEDYHFVWDSNLTDVNAQGALYGQYGGKACLPLQHPYWFALVHRRARCSIP